MGPTNTCSCSRLAGPCTRSISRPSSSSWHGGSGFEPGQASLGRAVMTFATHSQFARSKARSRPSGGDHRGDVACADLGAYLIVRRPTELARHLAALEISIQKWGRTSLEAVNLPALGEARGVAFKSLRRATSATETPG